ncbi:hypothetical protein QJQ45_008724 [Haematococcus lacustris]|nr:hypothetical protein QJQ45_008724 [Haematococcus lacustris]
MNRGYPGGGPPDGMPGPRGQQEPASKTGMPPECPRCNLVKGQFNRTIQNYQKAYKKKVEGLKTELKSTRNTNSALRAQVKELKSMTRLHAPSLVAGLLLGAAAACAARMQRLWPRKPATPSAADGAAAKEVVIPAVAAEPVQAVAGTATSTPESNAAGAGGAGADTAAVATETSSAVTAAPAEQPGEGAGQTSPSAPTQ